MPRGPSCKPLSFPRRLASALQTRLGFSIACSLLYVILTGIAIAHHEMWRDELEGWLLGRDTGPLPAFFRQMHYTGSPPFWMFSLWILSRIWSNPLAMQLWHLLMATGFVFVVCQWAPLTRLQKILLSLVNYYVFYQYGVVARNYMPGLLFLAIACACFENGNTRPYEVGLFLMLACLTSVHAWIVAAGLASGLLADAVIRWRATKDSALLKRCGLSLGLFAVGAVAAVALMKPAPDMQYVSETWAFGVDSHRLAELLRLVSQAFIAVPMMSRHFWETSLVASLPVFPILGIVTGLLLLTMCWLAVRSEPVGWVSFSVAWLGLLTFFTAKFWGYSRHHGYLFFGFLFAWWLTCVVHRNRPRWVESFLTLILLVQCVGGAVAGVYDYRYPFSGGKAAADWILSQAFPNTMLAVCPIYMGSSVVGYLHQPAYYPQGRRWGSFTPYNRASGETLTESAMIERVVAEAVRLHRNVLLAVDRPLHREVAGQAGFQFLRAFTGSIVSDEDVYLFFRPAHPA